MSTHLDCGHVPPTGQGCAHTSTGERICYACSNEREQAEIETAGDFFGYLKIAHVYRDSHNHITGHTTSGSVITTFPGGELARVIYLTRSRHNIGGYLYRGQAVTKGGRVFLFTSPGDGMYARLRYSARQTAELARRKARSN